MGDIINLGEIIPKIIENISFVDYLEKNGYKKKKSTREDYLAYQKDYGYIEDTIFLSNVEKQETYFSLSFNDKGNIIDFVKNRIELEANYIHFSPEKDHLIEACKKLVQFINDNGENEKKIDLKITRRQMNSLINNAFTEYYKAVPAHELVNESYLEYLNIKKDILEKDIFINKIFSTKGIIINNKTYNDEINYTFPIYNGDQCEIGLYSTNMLMINDNKQTINLFIPGSNKKGIWTSNFPNIHKNKNIRITFVDSPIEAIAHSNYINEDRQYISVFEIDNNTFECIDSVLTKRNYPKINLALGVSLENFEKEYKILIALLNIDAKFILSNFNEVKIWLSSNSSFYFLDLIKRIKKLNSDNISNAIKILGNSSKNHMADELIQVIQDERNNLIIQIPKNFKTLYEFEKIMIKVFESKYDIVSEKPKYMNWVNQNKYTSNTSRAEKVSTEEIFITSKY